MDRRKFLISSIAGVAAPMIIPSGRMFAATGTRKVKNVVFCLFAGGIRNFESLQMADGNLMPYMLPGTQAISPDIVPGIEFVPRPTLPPLTTNGTLFKEFRYKSNETIHYSGHAVAITGNYKGNFQIMKPLAVPTVFELFRKHSSSNVSPLKTWWVTDQAGPFPFLNCSNHKDYGPLYGANMVHPMSLFGVDYQSLNFFSNEAISQVENLRKVIANSAPLKESNNLRAGIINSDEERYRIEQFIYRMSKDVFSKKDLEMWDLGNKTNEDIVTMFTACEIISSFKPELLVVNMQHLDVGHSNFTQMCNNLQKADFALAKLWQTIQQTPGMKDDTVLIVAPEFGRNIQNNTVRDAYGRLAIDHTGDENSKKIFCLVLGPKHLIKQNHLIQEEAGESIDIVPTIASLLGFIDDVPMKYLKGRVLEESFI